MHGETIKFNQETYLRSVLQNKGICWRAYYKYVKRRTGNRENIPKIQDRNGRLITESIDKARSLSSYYASVFGCERNIAQIKTTRSGKPFTINIKMIKKRPAPIGRKKSIRPNGVPGKILIMGGEAMIPYLARLLDITINNATIPSDWKRPMVVPIYEGLLISP